MEHPGGGRELRLSGRSNAPGRNVAACRAVKPRIASGADWPPAATAVLQSWGPWESSGSVPAAIHVSPEALDGGNIARLRDGDIVRVDAVAGTLDILTEGVLNREAATADLTGNAFGLGRELFAGFRRDVGTADTGACALF